MDGDGDLDPNSWFSRSTHQLYFNDAYSPLGTNDFAKEDKIIQHEYSHAIIYDIESGIRSEFSEEGAISEGTPDYFAGSFKDRTQIGNYAFPFAIRDMANPAISSYGGLSTDPNTGEVNEEPHDGGEFFSAILWDLHNSMSPTAVDFLVYDALYRVTGDPNFLGFRDAMMAADDQAYSGSHDDLIQNTFAARGVGNYTPLNVTISGPSSINLGENATWSASVSDGTSPYTLTWYKRSNTSNSWTYLGSGSSITTSSGESFTLKVEVNDSGSRSGYDEYPVYVVGGIHP